MYFEWADQGASYYLLEIKNSTEYYYYFVTGTNKEVLDLLPNKLYVWSVRAFHDGYTGTTSPQTNFRTGNLMTGTEEESLAQNFKVFPNPVKKGQTLAVNLTVSSASVYRIELIDATGKSILQRRQDVIAGENNILLPTSDLATGIYLVTISGSDGVVSKKLIIE